MACKIISSKNTLAERNEIKCLVLDADGVLWDGILAEVGIEGINITAEHQRLHAKLLDLRAKGVLLAINTKNEYSKLIQLLNTHPDCQLKTEHFSHIEANWQPKSANMSAISNKLNILKSSIMFIDDTPFEREEVRSQWPQIKMLECEKININHWLVAFDNFTVSKITAEDKNRAQMYIEKEFREQQIKLSPSVKDFLINANIKMTTAFGKDNTLLASRLAQLSQKTNQFNFTRATYSEQDILEYLDNPNMEVVSCQLQDNFGNDGIVGLIVAKKIPNTSCWEILNFNLSCRVFGRDVELSFFKAVTARLETRGAQTIQGEIIPSNYNERIHSFYAELGFKKTNNLWNIEIKQLEINSPSWITVTDELATTKPQINITKQPELATKFQQPSEPLPATAHPLDKRLYGKKIAEIMPDAIPYTRKTTCGDALTNSKGQLTTTIRADLVLIAERWGEQLNAVNKAGESYYEVFHDYVISPNKLGYVDFLITSLVCAIIKNIDPPVRHEKKWIGEVRYKDLEFELFTKQPIARKLTLEEKRWINRLNNIDSDKQLLECLHQLPSLIRSIKSEKSWQIALEKMGH